MIPIVVVTRDTNPAQRVRRVTVNGNEVPCSSVSVERGVSGPAIVTLVLPAEYIEVDADD